MDTCIENKASPLSPSSNAENTEVESHLSVEKSSSQSESFDSSNADSNNVELGDELCDLSFVKDAVASLTSSPLENFKSSYAKSLADSYRRASLPVVVSSPRGQYYFNNDELISLNSSHINQNKCSSLNSSISATSSVQSFEPTSLPTALENSHIHQQTSSSKLLNSANVDIYKNIDFVDTIYVPFENINKPQENGEGEHVDGESDDVVTTSDGKKLVKLADYRELWKRRPIKSSYNGATHINGSEKDGQEEGLRLGCIQMEGRIQQLCEVLADRDSTIQRLEEDLLRMRMECQRLMVDNRSLKSTVSPTGFQPSVSETPCEVNELRQRVDLLNAQLEKAERSRRTYETATRQLVEFLHTVNTTLSNSSGPHIRNVSVTSFSEDANNSLGPMRRSTESVQRAESVYALPTHIGNRPRVNRSVSTYCVASIPSSKESSTSTGRTVNADFLVTRAKELIASLKSLTRSESVLKLNLEPKKPGSGISSKGIKKESTQADKKSPVSSQHSQTNHEDDVGGGPETLQRAQTPVKLGDTNSQPLSLMVVGETSAKTEDHGFSSLPVTGYFARSDDSDQRLIWV